MLNICALPAEEGDFFWISYGNDEKWKHILIDGGTKNCGNLYADVINIIFQRQEKIEALILTHVDQDHIQGILEGISKISADILDIVINKIYFNTGRGIERELCQTTTGCYAEDDIIFKSENGKYGIKEGISLVRLLKNKKIYDRVIDYVVSGQAVELEQGMILKFISPGEKELKKFYESWEKYNINKKIIKYSSNKGNIRIDLKHLMEENLLTDSSVNNKVSIAFLLSYQEYNMVFTGDSEASVCLEGLKKFDFKEPIDVDLFKISHHGSINNTSDELLKAIVTRNYLISTNGHRQQVPSKVLLAHILKFAGDKDINIFCNYNWNDISYFNKFFTENDYVNYINNNKLSIIVLDKNGIKIKDGCTIYGCYK